MKVRSFVVAALGVALLAGLSACQTGVEMWGSCSPAADGNPTGTDGTYVLVCKDGTWEPVMTVDEFVAAARGEDVTIAPLPTRPTGETTTTHHDHDDTARPLGAVRRRLLHRRRLGHPVRRAEGHLRQRSGPHLD